jgi:hypothetical protein
LSSRSTIPAPTASAVILRPTFGLAAPYHYAECEHALQVRRAAHRQREKSYG